MSRAAGAKCQEARGYSFFEATWALVEKARAVNDVMAEAKRAEWPKNALVVDVGCYVGRLLYIMEQMRYFPRYLGLDARRDYIEKAKADVGSASRVAFAVADIARPDTIKRLETGTASAVVCLQTLEHVEEAAYWAVLDSFTRWVKPHGLIIVGVPVNTREKTFHDVANEKLFGHAHIPVHEDLVEFMEARGCETLKQESNYTIRSSFRIPRELSPWLTAAKKQIGNAAFRAFYMAGCEEPTGGGYFVWRTNG